jgi:capsular polysaccharide biosynthesis protein
LYVIFTASEYRSKAEVLPEINNSPQSELQQLVQNYGGFLGINDMGLNKLANKQYISPKVYPVIVRSLTFQSAMLQDTVYFAGKDTSMTLLQFFEKKGGDDPGKAKKVYSQEKFDDSSLEMLDSTKISSLTLPQMKAIKELRDRINITFENGTGVMNVTATMPDAAAAAQVCSKTIEKLKDFVIKYHSLKAQKLLSYSNELYQDARKKFLDAQRQLAVFQDKHNNLITATAQSREKYLSSEYNLAYNVFNNVSQRRIEARMNLQKSIPVFNMLQRANVPLHRYSPKWIPVILVSIVVGLVLSFLVIAGLFLYRKGSLHKN